MKVSFIVPVYNETKLTQACLDSLETSLPSDLSYEIILVDDGSEASIATQLDAFSHRHLKVIHSPKNRGFAAANNLGVYHAKGEVLFLINNDLYFHDAGWFKPMLKAFDKFPDLGIVGNIQLNAKTKEIDHAGYTVDSYCRFEHKRTRNQICGIFTPAYSIFQFITGACCAIRKSRFLKCGGFDESFLNGCEDLDLCFKLRQHKLQVLVSNKSIVSHHISATRGEKSTLQQERNFRIFQNRWSKEILTLAAESWGNEYLKGLVKCPRLFSKKIFKDALLSIIQKRTSVKAVNQAQSCLERNARHWQSTLDGVSDTDIKKQETKKSSNWFSHRLEYQGLYTNSKRPEGLWLRDRAQICVPASNLISKISLHGMLWKSDGSDIEKGKLGLKITVNESKVFLFEELPDKGFNLELENPSIPSGENTLLDIRLTGTRKTNTYAYLGRILKGAKFIPESIKSYLEGFRAQSLNKRLRLYGLKINDENVLDFKTYPTSPLVFDYAKKHGNIGINLVGWFDAELGIGESARSAAKALKHSHLDHCLVPLKVNCLANRGDDSLTAELSEDNPHPVNIFHIDPPQSSDIDHHHGKAFRQGRYNIAYWAWELPEFPDGWMRNFKYYDEIWCPSHFVRDSIAMKSPLPVITVPHCIDFKIPKGDYRQKLNLPKDLFLFTFIYDLNSYQARKNPIATLNAFKMAFMDSDRRNDVGLVIKTQSAAHNPEAFAQLQELVLRIPNCIIIDQTLPRKDVYGLMQASDCYVSLHRSEGFGLTVAESMLLGKPVISTDWSATTEFLNNDNGFPVSFTLQELQENHGPYQKGQIWADPKIEDAAEHMKRLANDQTLSETIGQRATETIRARFSPQVISNIYEKRLKSIALW